MASTYRNEKHGFEMDFPEGWAITSGLARIPVMLSNVINRAGILEEFSDGGKGRLNIVVEVLHPESPPDINELVFTLNAMKMGYTDVQFGRIAAGGREHAWASYVMNGKGWLKKYMLVLNGHGYALTASCPIGKRSPEMERTWDSIAGSFRLLHPIDPAVAAYNSLPQVRRYIDQVREQLIQQIGARRRQ